MNMKIYSLTVSSFGLKPTLKDLIVSHKWILYHFVIVFLCPIAANQLAAPGRPWQTTWRWRHTRSWACFPTPSTCSSCVLSTPTAWATPAPSLNLSALKVGNRCWLFTYQTTASLIDPLVLVFANLPTFSFLFFFSCLSIFVPLCKALWVCEKRYINWIYYYYYFKQVKVGGNRLFVFAASILKSVTKPVQLYL